MNIVKLGEIIKLEYGKPLDQSDRVEGGLYPAYGANGIKAYTNKFYYDKPSIIVGRKGSAGELNLTSGNFWPLDVTYYVTHDETKTDLKYIFYLLTTLDLTSLARGVKPGINRNEIYAIDIPIFTLVEQQKIVSKLDAAFGRINKAIEFTVNNALSSQKLFESILTKTFDDIPNQKHEKLGKVYDVRDGTHDSPKYHKKGFPLITSKNLKTGILSMDNVQYISEQDYLKINNRSKVDVGDVLMAMIGTIGNPIIVEDEPNYAIKNVALFKPLNSHSGRFLKYYLQSGSVVKKMDNDARGATQRFVSLGYLRAFEFPVVSAEQELLTIKRLDEVTRSTQTLLSHYKAKLCLLNELKQSMLSQSFSESAVK